MENNALITFTMILPIIELCMGIANAVSVKDKIQYPINNPANIHSCDFVPFHAVLNTSDIINLGASGIGSNVYYTFHPSFNLLAEGKTQQVTDEPYAYILYAEFSTMAKINYVDVTDGKNKDVNAQGMFKMERSSIKNQFFYEIISERSQWLDTVIE